MAADTTYFLKILGGEGLANGGGGAPGGGGGGGDQKNFKAIRNELEKGNSGAKKGLGATLGIKFGVASLLKQSQVFTGFVGTIFQLMGALVDVILAPFLPILIPGIRLIASLIPYVSKYAQAIYDFLDRTIFQWFRSFPLSDKVKEGVKKALSAILVGVVFLKFTGLWNVFKTLVDNFIKRPIWNLLKKMFPQIDSLMGKFEGKSFLQILKMGGKAALRAVFGGWWDTLLLKLMFLTDFLAAPFKLLWASIKEGAEKAMAATLDDLVQRVWTNGLKAKLVTPLMNRLTGIANLIASPFKSLWKAITGDVATAGDSLIARGWTAFKRIPLVQTIGRIGSDITNYMKVALDWFVELPFIKIIKQIPKHLTDLFNWIPTTFDNLISKLGVMIGNLPVVGQLAKWLGKELMGKLGGLFKGAKGLAGKAFGGAKGLGAKALDVAAPGAAGMLGKLKPSMLLKAAQGFKAIPVLGAIAELGFGGWQTYKDYKKYGAKAALGRAALTLANTTTALFDPTGLASAAGSIGSNIAMDIAYKKLLDPKDDWKRANPDIWVQNPNPETGVMEWNKIQVQKNNAQVNGSPGAVKDKTVMDGTYP